MLSGMNSSSKPRSWIAIASALLAAALSSACCWLPLVALSFGLSAAGAAQLFEPYRPVLLGIAGIAVLGAFVWRRRAASKSDLDCCDVPTRRSQDLWLWISVASIGLLAFFPELLASKATDSSTDDAAVLSQPGEAAGGALVRAYRVEGMTCEGCTSLLKEYLEEREDIKRATVDYPAACSRITFASGVTGSEADAILVNEVASDWSYTIAPIESCP